jgi:cytochrome o ubiquinol oxidase operon protein cyoD
MTNTTLRTYQIGFVLSVLLTLGAFAVPPSWGMLAIVAIVLAAIAQLFVQLVFFLHLGRERGTGWNSALFIFTALIIGILVGGTLWIMSNLSHLHMQSPTTTDVYQNGVVAPQNELH